MNYLRHFEISELIPEIFDGVESYKSRAKHSYPFDTAHAADANSRQEQPSKPLNGETLMSQSVESCPTKHSGKGETQ